MGVKTVVRRVLPHAAYRMIRRRRVANAIRDFIPWSRVGEYGNATLAVRIADELGDGWYGHDWPLPPELRKLAELGVLRSGATVFDLGAHQGVVALMLAHEVGPGGRVVAVEADPHNVEIANENCSLNPTLSDRVTVVHAAVADHDGETSFAAELNGRIDEQTESGNTRVPAASIDTLITGYGAPDLFFVDIEGFEGRALKALNPTARQASAFFVEVHVGQLVASTAQQIVDLFAGRDRWIAVPGGRDDDYEFVPYDGGTPDERFYLIAT
jgi:FkbM family methyltransferase